MKDDFECFMEEYGLISYLGVVRLKFWRYVIRFVF